MSEQTDYCRICGGDTPKQEVSNPKHPEVKTRVFLCKWCSPWWCGICYRFIGSNGDGYQFDIPKDLDPQSVKSYLDAINIDFTIEDTWNNKNPGGKAIAIYLCNYHIPNDEWDKDKDDIESLLRIRRNHIDDPLKPVFVSSLVNSSVMSDNGDMVEPDSDESPLRKLGLI